MTIMLQQSHLMSVNVLLFVDNMQPKIAKHVLQALKSGLLAQVKTQTETAILFIIKVRPQKIKLNYLAAMLYWT